MLVRCWWDALHAGVEATVGCTSVQAQVYGASVMMSWLKTWAMIKGRGEINIKSSNSSDIVFEKLFSKTLWLEGEKNPLMPSPSNLFWILWTNFVKFTRIGQLFGYGKTLIPQNISRFNSWSQGRIYTRIQSKWSCEMEAQMCSVKEEGGLVTNVDGWRGVGMVTWLTG